MRGSARAQASLGSLYFTGTGVPRDEQQGLHWMRRAAEQGHVDAQAIVGYRFQTGRGTERDFEQARRRYL